MLLTVIPYLPISLDKVFDQLATAPLVVLDKPKFGIGSLTDVEIILIILPKSFYFIFLYTALNKIWLQIKCLLIESKKSSFLISDIFPGGGPPVLLTRIE